MCACHLYENTKAHKSQYHQYLWPSVGICICLRVWIVLLRFCTHQLIDSCVGHSWLCVCVFSVDSSCTMSVSVQKASNTRLSLVYAKCTVHRAQKVSLNRPYFTLIWMFDAYKFVSIALCCEQMDERKAHSHEWFVHIFQEMPAHRGRRRRWWYSGW